MRNQWMLQLIVTCAVIVCLTPQAWATPSTFRYDGKTFNCAVPGPFKEYVKTLQDERNDLNDIIIKNEREALRKAGRRALDARTAYNKALEDRDRTAQAKAETEYQAAMKERADLEVRIAGYESQLKAIQKKISEALGDFQRTCGEAEGCGPNPTGVLGQCRWGDAVAARGTNAMTSSRLRRNCPQAEEARQWVCWTR